VFELADIISEADYERIAVNIGEKLKHILKSNFVSFFLIGSLGRGDLAPGWSDFDSVLVVRENNEAARDLVKSVSEETSKRYPFFQSDRGSFISIYIMTLDDIINGKINQDGFPSPLNYHDFKFNSKAINGESLSARINVPEINERDIDIMLSANHEFFMKQKDSSPYWQGRNAIVFTLNIARLLLLKNGILASKKRDIVDEFRKLFPEEGEFLEEIAWSRENWNEIRNNDNLQKALYEKALPFINEYVLHS
jgi:hypothetical protein